MITQEKFEKAVRKHKPNKFAIWVYDNFSAKRTKEFLRSFIIGLLIGSFIMGFVGIIVDSRLFIMLGTFIFVVVLIFVVVVLLIAVCFHKRFVRKVCKELKVSLLNFNYYSEKFWYNGILDG